MWGNQYQRQMIKSLFREFLLAEIYEFEKNIGVKTSVDCRFLVPDHHFERRLDILSLLESNLLNFSLKVFRTNYLKGNRKSFTRLKKAFRYRQLYRSILKNGFEVKKCRDLPILFVSNECIYRLDGHHRASILRYLDYDNVPTLVIRPRDALILSNIPKKYKLFLEELSESQLFLGDFEHHANLVNAVD